MEKIVIIGSSGAGKTTFAIELGTILNIKVLHLDRHLWEHDWKGKTGDARKRFWKDRIVGKTMDY